MRRPPTLELFGRCSRGHRARLVRYDDRDAPHQESYARMLVAPHVHVYQVTCPVCGEEYTVSEARAERVTSR